MMDRHASRTSSTRNNYFVSFISICSSSFPFVILIHHLSTLTMAYRPLDIPANPFKYNTHSFNTSLNRSFTQSFTHCFVHPFLHSYSRHLFLLDVHAFVHSFICCVMKWTRIQSFNHLVDSSTFICLI